MFGGVSDGSYGYKLQDPLIRWELQDWGSRSFLYGFEDVEESHYPNISTLLIDISITHFLTSFLHGYTSLSAFDTPFLTSMGKQHGAAPLITVVASSFRAYGIV